MSSRQQGMIRSGLIISLLIAAAVVVLFLLPTPKPGLPAHAAVTDTAATTPADCIKTPAGFSSPAVLAASAPESLWKGWTYSHAIVLSATPVAALMDQSVTIRVSGLKPGEPVTLRASMRDYLHRTWSAEAIFFADDHGVVDVTRDAPKYGSYSGMHAMGLVWSMLPENVKKPQEVMYDPSLEDASYPLSVEALAGNRVLAQATLTRYLRTPGVTKTLVTADGLEGELYTPVTSGPHAAVLVLGGSEGGWLSSSPEAALLASHGYTALALAYFQGFQSFDPQLASLPKMLMNIPLEYFAKAADFLKQQPNVDPKHIAIIGWSKGAEAALITAATFPKEFQAVIGFMPSSVVWSGIEYGPGPISSSWTLHGKALPWVNPVINPAMFSSGQPLAFVGAYQAGLKDVAAADKAVIPVEKIAGPVLLISATDDQIWPSPLMALQIMQRLAAHHHACDDESLCYSGAGHDIQAAYRPTNAGVVAVPGGSFAFGGNPTAYAYADRDAWNKVLAFLHKSLH
ncbi:MAG TPA: acyl-CoA thioesterase/bile acid-CoA:amino acid N-acyltransferase family protein [Gammaproteobacteria bacterium]|nr:acyl-CoA thioesterase/bile acid-CoA:amino acid N-acyltransferase family protein [Gammaproteobacteria bacterium]